MSVTEQQIGVYMSARALGQSQVTSAAKAGFSERTGRRIERGKRSSGRDQQRPWRTRKDPFEEVWELVPELEAAPELGAITLLEVLQRRYPGQYADGQLRTLQRRVKQWKVLYGQDKEVMFRQERPRPGQLGLSDFTQLKGVVITVGGQVLRHRLYHFRLAYSGWRAVKVVLGGESYTALTEGLQGALRRLGGAPAEHRTDSLAAAFKNLKAADRDDLTQRYEAFCTHYGMRATRNNRGRGHENGAIESPHGHLKRRLEQALLLRGSADFARVADYQAWIDALVEPMNSRQRAKVEEERRSLQPLPNALAADYTELGVRVTSSSTLTVRLMLYSVPSRLIGERLRVHLYDNRLECYVGESRALELPRIYAPPGKRRGRRVDYRHVITSLKRKPMAFYRSQLRDDLLPSETYRQIWQVLDQQLPERAACKLMVGALALAAEQDGEQALGESLLQTLKQGTIPRLVDLQQRFGPPAHAVSEPAVEQHRLASYDELLSPPGAAAQEVSHA
jgi:hypothetical protein